MSTSHPSDPASLRKHLTELYRNHEDIRTAIQNKDIDQVAHLVELRSGIVSRMAEAHREHPLSEADRTRLAREDQEIQKLILDFKNQVGQKLQKMATVHRATNAYSKPPDR